VYLVSMRFFRQWKGDPQNVSGALIMIIASAIGAFTLSFSETFWFNASEAEVYANSAFFLALVVWITTEWYYKIGVFKTERSLLLIAYITGLGIGVHLLTLLALFFVFIMVYFRDRKREDITPKTFGIAFALIAGGFFVIYPGIVKYIPAMLGSGTGQFFLLVLVAGLIVVVAREKIQAQVRMVALAILLIMLGFSTYTLIPIRSGQQPALNENAPDSMQGLYSYLNRDQYGTYPLLSGPNFNDRTRQIDFNRKDFLPRRWSPEHTNAYANYSSDFEYFLKFQLGHIYLRYFMWNFVGRAGDIQDAPVAFIGDVDEWSESPDYPNRHYAIPLLLGLLGMYYHFRKDFRSGTATAALFFMTGIGLVLYFNMAEPQVRERDYFFVGSFLVFALWVGIGVYGLIDMLLSKTGRNEAVGVAVAVMLLIIGPGNMLAENYHTHDRHYNYVAFDYAYNLLQSCDQDAILFTGGDNDTFPVWYLQYVAGVRRDVRVVNLSLLNTSWYSKQMKNERPYGAKTIEFSYSTAELERLRPVQWSTQRLRVPIDKENFNFGSLEMHPYFQSDIELPDNMEFELNSTWSDPAGTPGLRVQDLLIIDILNNNFSERPICFALSTAPSDRLSLEHYLIVEGLVYRVAPVALPQRGNRYYTNINTAVTERHLLELRQEPDSTRSFGFMFRELNNPRINLDEASMKMIYSFRVLHMALAQVLLQDESDPDAARAILAKMEETIPSEYHSFDRSLQTDLANMYMMMDDTVSYREIADPLEKWYLEQLERDPTGQGSLRSPYFFLLEYYEVTQQWQKGIDILRRAEQLYPGDPSITERIRILQSYIDQGGVPGATDIPDAVEDLDFVEDTLVVSEP
jgi:hypothetical protein